MIYLKIYSFVTFFFTKGGRKKNSTFSGHVPYQGGGASKLREHVPSPKN